METNNLNPQSAILVHTTDLAEMLGASAAVRENLDTYLANLKQGDDLNGLSLTDLQDSVAYLTATACRLAESALKGGQ